MIFEDQFQMEQFEQHEEESQNAARYFYFVLA